jgi:putative hydrolase of the HAD superfamily
MQDPPEARLDWSRIDTVLLDMDGTLLDLRYDTEFWQELVPRHYARARGMPLDAAREHLLGLMHGVRASLDYYCFDWWSATTGLDIVGLKPELAHLIRYRPGAERFMEAVRGSGRRALIVTNSHPEGVTLKHRLTGIVDRVDGVESAHHHAHPKEAPEFWERIRDALDFEPARTLLVDDNLQALDCAAAFGIGQLRAITRPDSGRPALADLPWPAVDSFLDLLPPPRESTS